MKDKKENMPQRQHKNFPIRTTKETTIEDASDMAQVLSHQNVVLNKNGVCI